MRAVVGPCPWSPDTPLFWRLFEKKRDEKNGKTYANICILHAPPEYEDKRRKDDEKKYEKKKERKNERKKWIIVNGMAAYQTPVYCTPNETTTA